MATNQNTMNTMNTDTTEERPTIYTTIGSVRGHCGHRHRSLRAAVRCAAQDQGWCARRGGYSDRRVRMWDGGKISEDDHDQAGAIRHFRDY